MTNIQSANSFFILGIKGVAMTQIAIILKKMGKQVSGFDSHEEFITDEELAKEHIKVYTDQGSIPNEESYDFALFSAAHGGSSHSIIKKLQERGVTLMSQAQFFSEFSKLFSTTIAVCGAHGKTTTTALLSYSLIELGAEPTYMVGTASIDKYPAGDFRSEKLFIIEADEYGVNPPHDKTPKFHFLHPAISLCTNIDFDHPDMFESLEDVKLAYETFFKQSEYLIFCADNDAALEVVQKLKVTSDSYGFSEAAHHRIINHDVTAEGSVFDILYGDRLIEDIEISLFGDHNILNAAGVFLVLFRLGYTEDKIKKVLKSFGGAKRRFEVVYAKNNFTILDDYAHHPEEIKALIKAAVARYGKKPVIIFQPHTFSRTKSLLEDFSVAFSGAEQTFVLPIFASARENSASFDVTSSLLVETAHKRGNQAIQNCENKEDLLKKLSILPEKTVIITVGAGDVYKLKSDIIRLLES